MGAWDDFVNDLSYTNSAGYSEALTEEREERLVDLMAFSHFPDDSHARRCAIATVATSWPGSYTKAIAMVEDIMFGIKDLQKIEPNLLDLEQACTDWDSDLDPKRWEK